VRVCAAPWGKRAATGMMHPRIVGSMFAHYRLEKRLGAGPSGEVYVARETHLGATRHGGPGRPVALKLFDESRFADDSDRREFLNRVRAVGALHHPGVCPIFEADQMDGVVFVALALVDGETLDQRVNRQRLTLVEAIEVSWEIADVMRALFGAHMRFASLQLRNVFLAPAPGGAKSVRITELNLESHEIEAPRHGSQQDPDVLQLGGVLLHLLAGMDPTPGPSEAAASILQSHPDCPLELCDLVARCLSSDPGRSPASIVEILAVLEKYTGNAETGSEDPEMTRPIGLHTTAAQNGAQGWAEDRDTADRETSPVETWRDTLGRYTNLGLLGRGGMGDVYRTRDSYLNRTVAMKILRIPGSRARERFIEEAQVTAQLQHPAIIPVYDIGILADGRPFFTMKEIAGKTFGAVISEAHRESELAGVEQRAESTLAGSPGKWSLPRLISDFWRLCEGVAYAHKLGVLHRDLKPSNLMIGDFGEVLVVDWGLTRLSGAGDSDFEPARAPVSSRSTSDPFFTHVGTVIGTPSFMPPEQATGQVDRIGPHSDVYSLGAVLYTILDGNPPYSGADPGAALKSSGGPPAPLGRRASSSADGPAIPPELKAICEKAMAWSPADRYGNAGELAQVIGEWLEGAQRRERAMSVLAQARDLKPEIAADRELSAELEARAATLLEQIPPFAPVNEKIHVWTLQDQALALRNQAQIAQIHYTQLVRAALTHAGDLEAANEMLADYYHEQHARAEAARDTDSAAQFRILLADHDRGRYAAYLKGEGALTLETDPPGASALLFRHEEHERRLIPVFAADLGATPIRSHPLPMGSYLVRLSLPGRLDVDYPIFLERQQHWNGVRPGASATHPIYLPRPGESGPDDCYVPAGWFWSGGDPQARNGLPARRFWLDGFVMRRFHVTVGDYLAFLNDLVTQGREEEAALHAPPVPEWEGADQTSTLKGIGVIRDSEGRYIFTGTSDKLRWPQEMVNWAQAAAYAAWLAATTGLAWRLPGEMEYEKAARGVDCRFFPWGNFLDPTFCRMRLSHTGNRAVRALVDEYPVNVSVYGIRGLSGNVYSWCEDAFRPAGPTVIDDIPYPPDPSQLTGPGAGGGHRVVRGGSWRDPEWNCRAAFRDSPPAHYRDSSLGFRLLRSFPV
jgi:serine/threonine protein kinase/formylglycine-generating enzyme required for sulfatase activity